jgi:ABC-type antimicrobial peptide transport system permease subunit
LFVESATLGVLSAAAGVLLAVAANAALATYVFEASPWPALDVVLIAFAGATALAIVAGLLLSRGISQASPLQILRSQQ